MSGAGILHISDLHFRPEDSADALLGPLEEDLAHLPIAPAFVVITGDFVDRGNVAAFPVAIEFLRGLQRATRLPWDRFILCPGNHDVQPVDGLFVWKQRAGPREEEVKREGEQVLVRVLDKYPERFAAFSATYRTLLGCQLNPDLCRVHAYPEERLKFVVFNTNARIDEHRRSEAGADDGAVSRILRQANQPAPARSPMRRFRRWFWGPDPELRIAVWHHAVLGDWAMQGAEKGLAGRLAQNSFGLVLHGDVHEFRAQVANPFQNSLYVAGAGTLYAGDAARPPSTGYFYNLLEVDPDFAFVRVHVREQTHRHGPFAPCNRFDEGSYYTLDRLRINGQRPVDGWKWPDLRASARVLLIAGVASLGTGAFLEKYAPGQEPLSWVNWAWIFAIWAFLIVAVYVAFAPRARARTSAAPPPKARGTAAGR